MMNIFEKLNLKWQEMHNTDCPLDSKQLTFNALLSSEDAKKLCEFNYSGNRDLNNQNYRRFVRSMNLNRWDLTPEPLVFTKYDGSWVLINGNHRLNAQIEAGKQIAYAVSIVRELEIFKILDQGKTRSIHEILNIEKQVSGPIAYLFRSATFVRDPSHEDVHKVINTKVGNLLIEIEQEIKPPKSARSPWKSPSFRAAYVMAIELGLIEHEKARELYNVICHSNIKKWPDVFVSMHKQITEKTIGIEVGGRTLDNTNFMRGMYAFANSDWEGDHMSVHQSFRKKIKEMIPNYMKKYTLEEERMVK